MSIEQDPDPIDEEEYDEEADSDFNADGANEEDASSSSDGDEDGDKPDQPPKKRQKTTKVDTQDEIIVELDSGDEATIKEQKKIRRKQKKKGEDVDDEIEDDESGWRARTRAMRERDKDEKKRNKLANIEGATIDVDKIWELMNRVGPLPPVTIEDTPTTQDKPAKDTEQNKENIPAPTTEETITIKRKFKFAGEVHVEEKVVPKSSAEARLWLAQQETKPQATEDDGVGIQRPLRKISRFDPNYHNLDAFKMNWTRASGASDTFKGPKLNVVEKSKMDWASHVDAEGLKDELDVHAKAKEGYHSRMEFLNQVELRKEEEARLARTKR